MLVPISRDALRVSSPHPCRGAGDAAWSDICVLALIVAVHVVPLVALAAEHSFGPRVEGWCTVVVLVGGWELARELWSQVRRALRAGRRDS